MGPEQNNEQLINQSEPQVNQVETETKEPKKGSVGPIIGSIIVIILIILAGLYYLGSLKNTPEAKAPVVETNEEVVDSDIAEIEQVIDGTELDQLDQELDAIESEINAELENL